MKARCGYRPRWAVSSQWRMAARTDDREYPPPAIEKVLLPRRAQAPLARGSGRYCTAPAGAVKVGGRGRRAS